MTPWYATLVSTAGGALATVLGIFIGGFLSRRSQNEQWVRDSRAQTYSTFLQEFTRVEIEVREAYLAERPNECDWDAFNGAVVAMSLIATRDVGTAAERITDVIGRFCLLIDHQSGSNSEFKAILG